MVVDVATTFISFAFIPAVLSIDLSEISLTLTITVGSKTFQITAAHLMN